MFKDLKALSLNPFVGFIDEFVSSDEIEAILNNVSEDQFSDATLYVNTSQDDASPQSLKDNNRRTAKNFFFEQGINEAVDNIQSRVTALFNLARQNCENPVLIRYAEGGEYKVHFDSVRTDLETGLNLESGLNPRVFTGIVYLDDDFEGGETVFPRLDIKIAPKAGRLVVWQNLAGGTLDPHPLSLHAGLPVTRGEKNILSFWIQTPLATRELSKRMTLYKK